MAPVEEEAPLADSPPPVKVTLSRINFFRLDLDIYQ